MSEEFKNIGNLLKQRRKEMNLSLKEAENATSIRIGYLQSIEEGDMAKLISPIYAQGFLKQYATFLGIDAERILRENPDLFSRTAVPEFSYGIGTLEMRGNPSHGVKWFPNILWFLAVTLVFALGWLFAKFMGVL